MRQEIADVWKTIVFQDSLLIVCGTFSGEDTLKAAESNGTYNYQTKREYNSNGGYLAAYNLHDGEGQWARIITEPSDTNRYTSFNPLAIVSHKNGGNMDSRIFYRTSIV